LTCRLSAIAWESTLITQEGAAALCPSPPSGWGARR
jgi:hypothetical protein